MKPLYDKLEYSNITEMLAGHALSEPAKEKCRALAPWMDENLCLQKMRETTGARKILDAHGNPPLTAMQDVEATLVLCKAGAMLTPEQLTQVNQFLSACQRMQQYLAKAAEADGEIAAYGGSFHLLPALREEITRCIHAGQVDSAASAALGSIRRKIENTRMQVQAQLATLLQSKKQWLSDGAVVQRGGRYVLPVRREHKAKISGTVVDTSGTGGTVFIEPASVAKLQAQLAELQIDEENEVRKVLYTLSALVDENHAPLHINMEAMETLDVLFAKAKLSAAMKAGPVQMTTQRRLALKAARHPLLAAETCVPLTLEMDESTRGVIVTGPNTGGKTVALKTVGLLAMMAQSGLHVTAAPESVLCMYNAYLCDVGDGQSISENLSTFSSHMTSIIAILQQAGAESLVLLDELGSGTDPAEGMGIAIAVLEALRKTGCMLVATTHYPEVKQYALGAEGYTNARMAFDRETLRPTYRLEIGQAGESCALYIAQRLGLPDDILQRARHEAYKDAPVRRNAPPPPGVLPGAGALPLQEENRQSTAAAQPVAKLQRAVPAKAASAHAASFGYADSVLVYPGREPGIVFHTANEKGEVGVQVKGQKRWIAHKRVKLVAKAEELYPPDYDFSVVFDTVANRKARKVMEKGRHVQGNVIVHDENEWDGQ